MKRLIKIATVFLCMLAVENNVFAEVVTLPKQPPKTETTSQVTYTQLQSPTAVVNNPYLYMNKNIQFTAIFNKFSTLGLGYKPALREPQAYIGVLINRDDVGSNVIPLSEFKMFLKRSDAEKLTDLETGDSVLIKGKVFSVALGDPWFDIIELKILSEKKKNSTNTGK